MTKEEIEEVLNSIIGISALLINNMMFNLDYVNVKIENSLTNNEKYYLIIKSNNNLIAMIDIEDIKGIKKII